MQHFAWHDANHPGSLTSVINGDGVGLGLLRGDLGRNPRSGGEVRAIAASLARSLHLAPTLHRGQVGEKEKQVTKLQGPAPD